jgi:transcriptional regulator with PAS, ATPase and Fis domain
MHVLVIGTLAGPLGATAKALKERGVYIEQTEDPVAAIQVLQAQHAITHALCDAELNIVEFRRLLQDAGRDISIIACTSSARPGLGKRSVHSGSRDVLELPSPVEVVERLLAAEGSGHRPIIAEDPVTVELLKRATKIASSEASILILGESGTGKEMFARHIHQTSGRSAGPFVAVNCAAIPETLLESELFGYEKGAFSGAMSRRVGKFEAAHRGTLLLDEIGEIDIRLQAKLLRAIQEREIDRIGGDGPIKVNVRILATTNRNLRLDVKDGKFREDLYYRINVISLEIPPLRRRIRDIIPLADFFASKYAEINGVPHKNLSESTKLILLSRPWEGNVRELENAVHRAVLTSAGACLDLDDDARTDGSERAPLDDYAVEWRDPAALSKQLSALVGVRLDDVERNLILETLEHTHGNRTHAATMLGISIRALRNKIREYSTLGMTVRPPHNSAAA